MYDRSTGVQYNTGFFEPIYQDTDETKVDSFRIKGSAEYVHVAFLRLIGDKAKCSLMKPAYSTQNQEKY